MPVVLKGEATDWACTEKWTWEYLLRVAGDESVPFRGQFGIGERQRASLRDVIASVLQNGEMYGCDWKCREAVPEMNAEARISLLASEDRFAAVPPEYRPAFYWMFLGGDGTRTLMHQDFLATHSWVAVLRGRKRFGLYPADAFDSQAGEHNRIDPDHARQERYEGIVEAGDVVFIPSLWWHDAMNLVPTLSVTHNFCSYEILELVTTRVLRARPHRHLALWL